MTRATPSASTTSQQQSINLTNFLTPSTFSLPSLQWQVNDQGYPWVLGRNEVKAGQQITITTREDVQADER